MQHLHERLAGLVAEWRKAGYPHDDFPAIGEIFEYQTDPDTDTLRFLRPPQMRALETYWYLRLVRETPHVLDLYRSLYPSTADLLDALGLTADELRDIALDGLDALFDRIRTDDELVRAHKLESVRETLTLDYASYILALAMGAGKTILIGAIIATEFALAKEYPDADFVQNALVFAPGKTILEALRELAEVRYDRILPPRLYGPFATAVSLTFTRDGDPDIAAVDGSLFNVVVTNTEKIRIRSETIRKSDIGSLFAGALGGREDDARRAVANRRLMRIASLPHLAVFSDEAHHTYGQNLLGKWQKDPATGEKVFRESGIKQVRRTVDYLAQNTNVICVVNTTGTPYFQKQPLRDIIVWYGLSEGIRDDILKDVGDNVRSYELEEDQTPALVRRIVDDFFADYGDVRLPNGAPAKLALYFPKNEDLDELRPSVEAALAARGLPATIVLRNTSQSSQAEVDDFNRLNDPRSSHRVILLVNKGTEGWNCPSLFACALVRKLRSANNFVLQAATRCLRQVPGNDRSARIYLTSENEAVLDAQLRDMYNESLADLSHAPRHRKTARLVLRKFKMPPLEVTEKIRRVERVAPPAGIQLELKRPVVRRSNITETRLTLGGAASRGHVLRAVGEAVEIEDVDDGIDMRSAAVELAARYRLALSGVYAALRKAYGPKDELPEIHLAALAGQIEAQLPSSRVVEEEVQRALALVRVDETTGEPDPRGWTREQDANGTVWTAEIAYLPERERLLLPMSAVRERGHDLGFHYQPYDFDSRPEQDLFVRLLRDIGLRQEDVEDVYFTGSLTDPAKTDFFVQYRDEKGRWRRYSPDFVVRRKDGRTVIVEVKAERERSHPIDGENGRKAMALRHWQGLNPDTLRYEMVFTATDVVAHEDVEDIMRKLGLHPEPRSVGPLGIPDETLREFCEKWNVAKLELFGSAARDELRETSDFDLMVTFQDGDRVPAGWGDFEMIADFEDLVGRKVDLLNRSEVESMENWIRRDSILEDVRTIYEHAED